jgi:hypothetical protein
MADDAPDPQKLIRLARQTLSSAERRKKYRRIDFLDTSFWYPTQLAFFAAGSGSSMAETKPAKRFVALRRLHGM